MTNNYGRFGVGEISVDMSGNSPAQSENQKSLEPAPENPLRAFRIGRDAVGQYIAERAEIGHRSEPNRLTARAARSGRRAPGNDDRRAEPEATLPRPRASRHSSTSTHNANPALSARCGHARARPEACAISVGDDQCPITLWCRWTTDLSKALVNNHHQAEKFTHYLEINPAGLNVIKGRSGVYVIPNEGPLDLNNRIISSGKVSDQ
ncbi:HYD1 signature containing ADP-ribosyltransferase family protein [Bradyrhizobium embrapense]